MRADVEFGRLSSHLHTRQRTFRAVMNPTAAESRLRLPVAMRRRQVASRQASGPSTQTINQILRT